MTISPPNYQKDAVPTSRGWTHPRTGELLKAQKLSEQQIAEYNGAPVSAPQTLTESPTTEQQFVEEHLVEVDGDDEYWHPEDLQGMSKVELEELGREYGIELDRRHTKQTLIEELEAVMFE